MRTGESKPIPTLPGTAISSCVLVERFKVPRWEFGDHCGLPIPELSSGLVEVANITLCVFALCVQIYGPGDDGIGGTFQSGELFNGLPIRVGRCQFSRSSVLFRRIRVTRASIPELQPKTTNEVVAGTRTAGTALWIKAFLRAIGSRYAGSSVTSAPG